MAHRAVAARNYLHTSYPNRMLILLSGGLLLVQMGRGLVPNLLPTIIDALSISPFLAGSALSLLSGLHALFQYPGGRLSDRLSRKTVLIPSLGVASLGLSMLVIADTYAVFLAGMAVTGIGSGLFYTPMRSAIADLFVEQRGQAMGISQAAGSVGRILAAGLAVAVIAVTTWRAAFLPLVIALLALLILLHWTGREPYVLRRVDLEVRATGERMFRDANMRWLICSYSLYTLVFIGTASFLPTYLQVAKGFSPAFASGSYALLSLTGVLAMPLSGWLSDRRSRTHIAALSMLVGGVGLAALVVAGSTPLVLVSIVVFAGGMASYAPVMQAYLMDSFPVSDMGGDFGAVKTVYTALGSLGPVYLGYMADTVGYATAFWTLVGGLVVSAGIVGYAVRSA